MSVEFESLSDDCDQLSPSLSPVPSCAGDVDHDLNSDPFLSFTGSSLLDGFGYSFVHHQHDPIVEDGELCARSLDTLLYSFVSKCKTYIANE